MTPATETPTYADRIRERTRLWWAKDHSLGDKRYRPDDPDERTGTGREETLASYGADWKDAFGVRGKD